ncbi:lipopolysaccharide biosynthesis protein [Streptomyces canus]|uniref:lipopolysaccharide biosynthesis protein n=1 Tax=Streptomyces canus TaxID=58343 RepID=UPI0036E58189
MMRSPVVTRLLKRGPDIGPRRIRSLEIWSLETVVRNGHMLTLSSLLTSLLGALYWAVAAHSYSTDSLGRNYSAVAAMMLLAGVGQLNMTNVMIRFTPGAGHRSRRLVAAAYLAACLTTAALAVGWVLLIPAVSPGLMFLRHPFAACGYVLATVGYAIFVLQDGVLTGLRRPGWVVLENLVFALAKIGFVVLLAFLATTGILWSWALAVVVAIALTNTLLFARFLPRRTDTPSDDRGDTNRPTGSYIIADCLAALFWLAATASLPIIVLNHLGARQAAYFSLAWLVAFSLYQLNTNMGASLIVEAANDPSRLAAHCRLVLRHTGALLVGGVALLCVAAPLILRIFGPEYARYGANLLRLTALSALPNIVTVAAVSMCRVQRRLRLLVGILGAVCTLATVLTYVLLPVMGITGVGAAWLLAQTAAAGVLWWRRSSWLPGL